MDKVAGKKNICGDKIRYVRLGKYDKNHMRITQSQLAARLQSSGLMVDRLAINRIELGTRSVSDIELICIAKALKVSVDFLISDAHIALPEIKSNMLNVAEESE